jgi:LuxR family transcriptional regulator, maltose regulon positive regulatory protein
MYLSGSLRRKGVPELADLMDETSPPVTAAKVRIPAGTATVLDRERLHLLLDRAITPTAAGSPVTVVNAPAGGGKTLALATWVRSWVESGNGCAAWVSVDAGDNDPALLWSAILQALRCCGAWERNGPLDLISPGEPDATFLAAVGAAFEAALAPVVLVLDGVHEIHSEEATHPLNLLLRHTPAMLRVVLASRFPPPLNLARLAVEGRLREIGTRQLNFTPDEARLLYAVEGILLAEQELRAVMARTEGWPAALRLATLTVRETGFTGDERVVTDYLIEEILNRQPADVRDFMLSTSVSRTFTAGLAAVLCPEHNVSHILNLLERSGIVLCDRGQSRHVYRYHPMLGRCLRAELGRRRPAELHHLHRTAADWYLAAGDPLRALVHAIVAKDDDLAVRLVVTHGLEYVLNGESSRFRGILDSAPQHVLAQPRVALLAAETALDLGDVPGAERRLRGAGERLEALRDQRSRVLHAGVLLHRSLLRGDVGAALAGMRTTIAGETGDRDLDLFALLLRGVAEAWTGNHHAATTDLRRALDLAEADHRDAMALRCRVHLAATGDLTQLSERAESALEFAESRGLAQGSRCAQLHLLLGAVAYQRLDDQRVEHLCTLAGAASDRTVQLFAHSLRALVAGGTVDDARSAVTTLREHWQNLDGRNLSPVLLAYLMPACQRMALRAGNRAWAQELVDRVETSLVPSGEQALLRATLHAHNGKTSLARQYLTPVLDGQDRIAATPTLIDAWLLEAHLAHRTENAHRAHEALTQALATAAPHHALRPFLDAGQTVHTLLTDGTGRFGSLEPFAATVLATIAAPVPDLTDGLTRRELALLAELPSLHTTEEIARSLFVSVNTVKTHIRGIYRKLGVNRRRDAVVVARQRGLL